MSEMKSPHTVSSFDMDMESVFIKLDSMGDHAVWSLESSISAIRCSDVALARSVVVGDAVLDRLEIEVGNFVVRTIALRQPVARDLRELIAAIKIASCLERVGDLSKNISKRIPFLLKGGRISIMSKMLGMGDFVVRQLRECLVAYRERDCVRALEIWKRDVDIDEFFNSVFCELVRDMSKDGQIVPLASQMMFLAKNLERIGDHTTFVSEMVYYVVGGEFMIDNRPKDDFTPSDMGL